MLILASASKARRDLLRQLSIDHLVMISDVNENDFSHTNVKELVQMLSIEKAKSVLSKLDLSTEGSNYKNKALAILGCDSLFELNGKFFGKPKNSLEASQRLKMISSRSGKIHTGHCLLYRKSTNSGFREEEFSGVIKSVISTKINFSALTDAEIAKYVQTEEPMRCAGGFSLEGKGSAFIEGIEGCYSNVIGLSLPWLKKALNASDIPFMNDK